MPGGDQESLAALPLGRWGKPALTVLAVLCCAAFGWIDVATGRGINVSALYLLPSAATAWLVGRGASFFVIALGTLIWVGAEHLTDTPLAAGVLAINAVTRTLSFWFIAELIVGLRRRSRELAAARDELSRALGRERRSSRTDPLTGLANRRGFLEALERAMRARDAPFTLALLDLDEFKAVNDAYGHQRGDDVLRRVAEELNKAVREGDTAARLGGDEFAVLFERTTPAMAELAMSRLTHIAALAGSELAGAELAGGPTIGLDIRGSVGVVHFERPPTEANEALEAVDQAMYEAKAAGKGRLVARPVPANSG